MTLETCLRRSALFAIGLLALCAPTVALAGSIDETINSGVSAVTGPFVAFIFSPFPGTNFPWIVLWLVIAATIFTLYFGFIQIRAFRHSVQLVRGDYANPNDAGEVSHFQALATALSGTVGLGNIAGVAVAVSIGGPGATFWMILAGLTGMASKFTECTLGVKYRNEYPDGTVSGGPMYYLSKGLAERGFPSLGRSLAVIFAVLCMFGALGGGNMFQANQVHAQLVNVTGGVEHSMLAGNGWFTGLLMASLVFAVIVGGIKSIARVTEKIVPVMALIYLAAGMVILIMHANLIPWAFGQIINGAFTGLGVAGGIVGALIQGFKRAAFSNEAGVGSAAIAHSAVRTNEPISEGFVSLLEPFVDTVVICTMTALVIVITGVLMVDPETGLYQLTGQLQPIAGTGWQYLNPDAGPIATENNLSGVALTSAAFGSVFGWFPYVLAMSVVLFAFSTMISWSYYGVKAWTYLFGEETAQIFRIIFCVFVVIGAAMKLDAVIDFADAAIFAMALINIIGLYILMPVVKRELDSYLTRLKSGEIKKFNA